MYDAPGATNEELHILKVLLKENSSFGIIL